MRPTRTAHKASARADAAFNLKTLLIIRGFLLARVAWWPATAYLASAAAHLIMLWALTDVEQPWGSGLLDKLTSWDGRLLIQVGEHGYPDSFTYDSAGKLTGNNLAFMPLFPLLVRFLHTSTGMGYQWSAVVLSNISFFVFLVAFCSLMSLLHDRKTSAIATFLVAGAQPMGIVFFMGYTESLFCALSVGSMLAVCHRRWITAGVLCSLAGLTRPAGAALCVALAVAVAVYFVDRHRMPARPLLGLFLGCLGLPLYLVWVGLRVGAPNAWFTIQEAGWGTRWDNGRSSLRFMETAFTQADGWVLVSTAVLVTVLTTVVLSSWRSTWLPLAVYGTMIVVMTLGQSNYYHSKLRLLLPAVVVAVPVSLALSRAKNSTVVTSVSLGIAFSSWYGAYMLTVWHYAI